MKYQKEIKFMHKHRMDIKKEEISDRILRKIMQKYLLDYKLHYNLLELKNIVPLYLIFGFIYLKRYLKNVKNKLRDSVLTKIFLTCCWIGIKNFNDSHVLCQDFLDNYKYNNREITFIEAHILSKINYDLEITHLEMVNWDFD